jgi:O-methyltransferase involved in polyketide biosynthesis
VHFIAADLSQEALSLALARSTFDTRLVSFFSWLGVTMYLSRQANLSTFRSIAACVPVGSEVVFTYMDERVFEVQPEAFREMQERVAAIGEPFISGSIPVRSHKSSRTAAFGSSKTYTAAKRRQGTAASARTVWANRPFPTSLLRESWSVRPLKALAV